MYWVNTSKLFKPFVYHVLPDTTVRIGQKFDIPIPKDYFKDINDEQLTYSISHNEFNGLNFDSKK